MSPVWSILQQLYGYTALLDAAVNQLCGGVSLMHNTADYTAEFNSFSTTTILASSQKDVFSTLTRQGGFSSKQERSLRSLISSIDKHGWARAADHVTNLSILHRRIGDEALKFMLTKCSLFVKVGANYVQISGIPIYNVIALTHTPLVIKPNTLKRNRRSRQPEQDKTIKPSDVQSHDKLNEPPPKKLKPSDDKCFTVDHETCEVVKQASNVSNGSSASTNRKWRKWFLLSKAISSISQAERSIQRRIQYIKYTVYKKLDLMYNTSAKEGLRKSYDLSVYNDSRRGAIKLVKKIFIDKQKIATSHLKKNEKSTSKKISRLPQRYKSIVRLFQTLLSNYNRKMGKIVHILNKTCPLTNYTSESKCGGEKLLFLQLQCNQSKVVRFIMCTLNSIIPAQLWGSLHNKTIIFNNVQRFIVCLRRWERISVRQMMHGMKISHCVWLRCGSQGRCSGRSDSLKQNELMCRWIAWVMTLVVELMKGFFYTTEHCDHHNRIIYFRKPVWNQLCRAALDERRVMFHQLTEDEVDIILARGKSLGVSNVRFMPKTSSLRPITNLGSAAKLNHNHFVLSGFCQRERKPVNAQLLDLFKILKFEKSQRVSSSSSCMGYRDIHNRLTSFSKSLQTNHSYTQQRDDNIRKALSNTLLLSSILFLSIHHHTHRPPLYIVHVDITNCFDSVLPRQLYSSIQKIILTQKSYLLRRYTTVMIANQSIRRLFIKTGTTRELCDPFLKFVESLPLRNAILTDMVAYPVIDRLQLLSLLKSHLFNNIVKFRSQFFRQTKGIPQGSCISSLLCSFYYDEMVKEHLPQINPATDLLMHYVDDFLLMTQNPHMAKIFLQTMTEGIPEYNCFINSSKTCTNFTVGENGDVILSEDVEWMAWCGLLIDTKNLEVRSDYSRYANKKIRDHLTIVTHPRPFHQLHRLVQRSARLKCQPIYLDCKLLSEKTVLCNIYQLFLLVAVKTHAAVRALQLRGSRIRKYTKFLFSAIQQCAKFFYNKAITNCRESEDSPSTFTLPLEICTWLCCHAYQRVLQKKDARGYHLLVKILTSQINSVADTMGLKLVKRCLRATTLSDCQPIIRLNC